MKRTVLIFALLILTISGCGGDSGTNPQSEEDIPLAADTIGAAGGTLISDEFELEVPAGAFDADAELKLYESSEDHGFGDNCISRFFRLEGLPETFNDTLTVRIDFEGSVSESTYVGAGEKITFYEDGIEPADGFIYSFYLATTTSGCAEAKIPPPDTGLRARANTRAASTGDDHYAVFTEVRVEMPTEHFTIDHPLEIALLMSFVEDYIEAAHDTVVSVGMGYAGNQWSWPAKLTVSDFSGGGLTRHRVTDKGLFMCMKPSLVTEDMLPEARRLLGNLMVRAAQNIPNDAEYLGDDYIPWHNAVVCYMQEEWMEPSGFTRPPSFAGREPYALSGLPIGSAGSDAPSRAIGWAAVVKHLTGLYGRKIIGDVYKITQTTTKNPVKALFEVLPDPAYNWWPQFVDKYVTGQYYGVEPSVLLLHISTGDKYTIGSASDTLKTYSHNVPQVSARMNRIYLDYALISEDVSLEINLGATEVNEDYYTLLVYKTKDGAMELVGSGHTVTVTGLRDLTIAGYDIIPIEVISYNDEPYTQEVSTKLKYRVTTPPAFNRVYITLNSADIQYEDSYGNEWWDDYFGGLWTGIGTWNGNAFHASWTNRDLPGVGTATGNLDVTIDPDTKEVLTFRAVETRNSTTGFTYVDSIVGHNVPLDYETPAPGRVCQITGTGACSSIDAYAYRRDDPGSTWIRSKSYTCQATTSLAVSFWRDSGE